MKTVQKILPWAGIVCVAASYAVDPGLLQEGIIGLGLFFLIAEKLFNLLSK